VLLLFTDNLGFDPRAEITNIDWLSTPTQTLAEVTAGAVFHDGLDELAPARSRLTWYPDQVWRYVLACQWQRVSQEEVLHAERFSQALAASITNPDLRALPLTGAIDQFADNTDLLDQYAWTRTTTATLTTRRTTPIT
jgi:hypothetical protein